MPIFRIIKNSFLGGQVSRTAVGRTDLPQYQHSCEILQNMIPLLSGGAYRRPGTLYQDALYANSNNYDKAPRLIPFIVSRNEAYCVALSMCGFESSGGGEPGGCYIRTYRATGNGNAAVSTSSSFGSLPYKATATGQVSQLSTVHYHWLQSYPNAVGSHDDDVWLVQYAQSNDVMWLVHPSYKPQTIKRTALDTFTIGAFDSGLSGFALAQAYPYLNQNATSTYMNLSADSGTGVTLTCSTAFFNNLHVGAIFAIAVGTTQGGSTSGQKGGMIFAQVTACSGTVGSPSTTCTVTIIYNQTTGDFSTTGNYTRWWESAWSNYRGWPSAACVFQQRLCLAGALDTTDALGVSYSGATSIWCTGTGDYFKFSALGDVATAGVTGTLANGQNYTTPGNFVYYNVDDSQGDGQSTGPIGIQPFRVTLADDQEDTIQWLSPDQQILVGALDKEYIVAPQNGTFDVANSTATIQSHYGSDYLPAVRIGYELMFALRGKDEVRAYQYNYIDASFFGEPVQLFFDEYPEAEENSYVPGRRKIRQMDWDVTRNTLWLVDTAGNLYGMTRDRKLQVTMWHTHQFGGYNTAQGVNQDTTVTDGTYTATLVDPSVALCDGSAVSMALVPNPLSGINDIWMCVKRSQGGHSVWNIERIIGKNTVKNSAYDSIAPGNATEPVCLDAAVIIAGSSSDPSNYTFSVGNQLNGYTLTVTYYSQTYGMFSETATAAVSSGNCILPSTQPSDYGTNNAHTIVMGLPYTPIIKPVRPDVPSQVGTSQGAIKRSSAVNLRLFKTLLGSCGAAPGAAVSSATAIPWDAPATMGQSPEIYTGDKRVFIATQYDRDGYIYITQPNPFPFCVVSLTQEGGEYEQ